MCNRVTNHGDMTTFSKPADIATPSADTAVPSGDVAVPNAGIFALTSMDFSFYD